MNDPEWWHYVVFAVVWLIGCYILDVITRDIRR